METLIDRINIVNEILKVSTSESISDDLDSLKLYQPIYPEIPTKPFLNKKHTALEALSYAESLVEYEKRSEEYRKAVHIFCEKNFEYHEIIKDFIIKKADLSNVPSQYIKKLWDIAYESRSSYGYHEVYYFLLTLKSIFDVTY